MENNVDATKKILYLGGIVTDIFKLQFTGDEYSFPADVDFGSLYKFCEKHKLTSLVASTVMKAPGISAEDKQLFSKQLFRCAARHTAQEKEMQRLIGEFTEAGIKHCFLKGTKVSRFYDEPDLRFMLDMDVYIEPQKIQQACEIMEKSGYEKYTNESDKDIGYAKKPFLNIELHKELKYDYDKGYEYYKGAFERLEKAGDTLALNMTNEDFYVYILSHTAHHFATGGTGIRSVVDHYYLRKKLKPLCDQEVLSEGLRQTGLGEFNNRMDALCDYWFGDSEGDPHTLEMAEYIVLSGVYGTAANGMLSGVLRGEYTTKKSSYFIFRMFPGYKKMCIRYPILRKLPFLLPVMWLVRLAAVVLKRDEVKAEFKNVDSASDEAVEKFKNFLEKNGL